MSSKTNKLTIYLIKSDLTDFSKIAKEGLVSHKFDTGTFFMLPSNIRRPEWVREFFDDSLPMQDLIVSSARGLFLTQMEVNGKKRIFAITFGSGRFMLEDGVVEERFGLRVTLNSVMESSLRSIDKVSLGATSKHSREQISQAGGADSFGIDIEQDLISAATGKSRIEKFGKVVSGKDSLAVSAKFDVYDIEELLKICLAQYESTDYKKEFDWIDQIKDIRDKALVGTLNNLLLSSINKNEIDKVWLVPPEVIDWADVKGFRHVRRKKAELELDLALPDLLEAIGQTPLALDHLKQSKIHLISAKADEVVRSWGAYQCIYSEIDWKGRFFLLNGGKWYEVNKDFTDVIKKDFAATPSASLSFIDYTPDQINENGYNKALSASLIGSYCMDANNIVHGGGKSKIEFCDVLTAENHLIHVKRYSGSGQLSHLFAQGVTSAELFAGDEAFRVKLNAKLPDDHKIADPSARPDTSKFEVVYGIISKSAKDLDIPFFSKVTLKNAKARLSRLGYKVSINKIQANLTEDEAEVLESGEDE